MDIWSAEIGGSHRHNGHPVAGNVPAADSFQVDPAVWKFVTSKANALIIGEGPSITRVFNVVWPTLRKPVVHCEGRRLILPVDQEGTLVIGNAHQLADRDQQRLLEWWDPAAPRTRIIVCASP